MFGMNDAATVVAGAERGRAESGRFRICGIVQRQHAAAHQPAQCGGKTCDLAKTNVALADCADNNPSDSGYCPPYPNLNTGARNVLIQQYNVVVDELVSNTANGITVTPPDFYMFFSSPYPYPSEYHNWSPQRDGLSSHGNAVVPGFDAMRRVDK